MTTTPTTSAAPSVSELPLAPGRWALDPFHSSVGFVVRHLGVSKVRGRFDRFEVDVHVGATLDDTSVTATIDVSSVDTGNPDRDAHVLAPDILDVSRRPTISFRSERISGTPADLRVDGALTIGEVTRPVVLRVELGGVAPSPDGTTHAGFEATAEIRRSEFGIDIAAPPGVSGVLLGDVIKIDLDLQLISPT